MQEYLNTQLKFTSSQKIDHAFSHLLFTPINSVRFSLLRSSSGTPIVVPSISVKLQTRI